jgi:hypothetical protein
MSEENTPTPETTDTTATAEPTNTIDLDQTVKVGGNEYSISELVQAKEQASKLQAEAEELNAFKESTFRLMSPDTDNEVRKRELRAVLSQAGYNDEQINEYTKVYEQGPTNEEESGDETLTDNAPMEDSQAREQAARVEREMSQMRARMLNDMLEREVSSALSRTQDGKVLEEWLSNTRSKDQIGDAKSRLNERVRAQTLENLKQRRNQAGTFDESWVAEEVTKASEKVAKDMLTVIGDTSKIGRVPETAGQTESLVQRKPVELPDTTNKSYGDVEGQLRDWTSDQILRSLSDPGGDSKA